MAEDLMIAGETKTEKYENLLPQIKGLLSGESNRIANMANLCAALKTTFNWYWIGFYWVDGPDELVLGPFQGPIACTRIKKGKGVCGTAWQEQRVQIVPDVEAFPGHIACSAFSKSEIVLPVWLKDEVIGVLDIDSDTLDSFDAIDEKYLKKICEILVHTF
ncbi:GAF domain-containing protein [Lishizhenia tianjinensis]|uniref:GAF domain-containing protein n=1 Tax=Lishizhenia tianjinensis TaxID=477690 RepID=A0A1I7BAS6_9FLAO|nr:GAF domain-containing protein [Lishizhenia tianjinensis]SFT84228.1 GAF domain-containing protein [Lishizhenia tianjinensis]